MLRRSFNYLLRIMKNRQFITLLIVLLLILIVNAFYTNSVRLEVENVKNEVWMIKALTDSMNDKIYDIKSDVWIIRMSM